MIKKIYNTIFQQDDKKLSQNTLEQENCHDIETIIEQTISFNGQKFAIQTGNTEFNMSYSIPEDGIYEPWVTKFLKIASEYYGDDKDAIDIGANIGMLTLVLASLQKSAKVIAFEPLSIIGKQLLNNCKVNGMNNVKVENLIVSDSDDLQHYINVPLGNTIGGSFVSPKKASQSMSTHSELLSTITLDSYLENQKENLDIKIIKIDVECWEKQVLTGAEKSLKKHDPVVFIEFNVDRRDSQTEEIGYQLYKKLISLFKYIFLIDRLTEKVIKINSYSELRGLMLTGHFVEDLICFNEHGFHTHLKKHLGQQNFSTYFAARTTLSKKNNGFFSLLSHYPDSWCHGHNFLLIAQSSEAMNFKIEFQNVGPYSNNKVMVFEGNNFELIKLDRKPSSREFHSDQAKTIIYIFIEKTFWAKEHMNPNDPRELGVQITVNEIDAP